MQKISILFVALIAMFYSCSDPSEFVLEGTIQNFDGKSVSLEEIGEKALVPFDSAKIGKDGNFIIEGKIKEPKFFILKINQEYVTLFIEPGDNITIEGEAAKMNETYKVEGSQGSKAIKEFNSYLYANLAKLDSIGKVYQSAMQANQLDSVKESVEIGFKGLIDNQKAYTTKFIEDNMGSLVNIFVIHQQFPPQQAILSPSEDMELFEKVLNSVKKDYPENMYVKSFESFINSVKQQLEQQADRKPSPKDGMEAPDIALPSPQGDTIKLSSLRGQYVLLDFWAAWCRPCRQENPNLVTNYQKYGGKNFTIYQVSLDQTKEAWTGAIEKDNLGKWYHVSDLKYWDSAPAKLYGVQGIPANYLINPEGKIIAQNLRGPALGNKLAEIFGK